MPGIVEEFYGPAAARFLFEESVIAAPPTLACELTTFASPDDLFSTQPRRTVREIFNPTAACLFDDAYVEFGRFFGASMTAIEFCGSEEPHLKYAHFPETNAIRIDHIHAGGAPGAGRGSAMIASQLPLWADLGIRRIVLSSWDEAIDFYIKLGFAPVKDQPPEFSDLGQDIENSNYMLLDLNKPAAATSFFQTLERGVTKHNTSQQTPIVRGIDLC